MTLLKLQERINSIVAENIASGRPEWNNLDVVTAMMRDTPKGRRRSTLYIPLNFAMQHPLRVGSLEAPKNVFTLSAHERESFTCK